MVVVTTGTVVVVVVVVVDVDVDVGATVVTVLCLTVVPLDFDTVDGYKTSKVVGQSTTINKIAHNRFTQPSM